MTLYRPTSQAGRALYSVTHANLYPVLMCIHYSLSVLFCYDEINVYVLPCVLLRASLQESHLSRGAEDLVEISP